MWDDYFVGLVLFDFLSVDLTRRRSVNIFAKSSKNFSRSKAYIYYFGEQMIVRELRNSSQLVLAIWKRCGAAQ